MSEIELCKDDCKKYHTKQFIADQLHVSLRTLYYRIEKRGLPVTPLGTIYCPSFRDYCRGLQNTANSCTVNETDAA